MTYIILTNSTSTLAQGLPIIINYCQNLELQCTSKHLRNFGRHIKKKRDDWRGIMTINNKSHFLESLSEVSKKEQHEVL